MNDSRDVSQLRIQLQEYILDAEAEIRAILKVGIFRGTSDPTVKKMQQVVDDLIAKAREDARAAALRDIHAEVQRIAPALGLGLPRAGVLVDVDRVLTAIEDLEGQR